MKQEDSLSPLIFMTVMDKVIKHTKDEAEQRSIWQRLIPTELDSLLYADDILLVAKSSSHGKCTNPGNRGTHNVNKYR